MRVSHLSPSPQQTLPGPSDSSPFCELQVRPGSQGRRGHTQPEVGEGGSAARGCGCSSARWVRPLGTGLQPGLLWTRCEVGSSQCSGWGRGGRLQE